MNREDIVRAMEAAQRKVDLWSGECNQLDAELRAAEEEYAGACEMFDILEQLLCTFDEEQNGQ